MGLLRRLTNLFRREHLDTEVEEELRAHLELAAEEAERSGMSPEEAHRLARLRFGNVGQVKEMIYLQKRLPLLEVLARDLRFAFRALAREPRFTLLCILTLGLAIGASTSIFSVVNAVLLRPLPYPDADRLVQVWETNPQANRWGDWVSYPDVVDWNRENQLFDGLAAFRYSRLRFASGPYPEMLTALRVSPGLFAVLRISPLVGRPFLPEDDLEGRSDVAILSHGLWQRLFGSDRSLVGGSIVLDDRAFLVAGVMPAGFNFPADLQGGGRAPDVWIPIGVDRDRGSHNYRVIARLKADRTVTQAGAEMERLVRLVAEGDRGHQGRGGAAAGLQQHTAATVRPALLILMGAVVLVLFIACANVASLLLARGVAREKEVALRLALGAGVRRVLQEGLTESLLLAMLAGTVGTVFAFGAVQLLHQFGPAVALVKTASIDARVLLFAVGVVMVTGIGFGLAPTLQALKVSADQALKESGPRQAGSAGLSRVRSSLTIAEISVSVVLLVGAGLLARSFNQLRSVDMGFDTDRLLTAFFSAPREVAADPERTASFFATIIERVSQVPGVKDAAVSSAVPLLSNETSPFRLEGRSSPDDAQDVVFAEQPKITPDYFRTMGIRLLRGRAFGNFDTRKSEPVVIVSKALADTWWPGEDAIGKRLTIDDHGWRTVVGLADDVRYDGLDRPLRPTIYLPIAQFPRSSVAILVRTASDPALSLDAVRRAVAEVDRNQPLFGIQTMQQALSESISLKRFLMILIATFASVAVVIGVVGVYGVLAYFVSQRRREIGIRTALGAGRVQVVRLVVAQGMRLAIAGISIGLIASLGLSRVLERLLFGVTVTDPWTFAIVPAGLFVVVLVASFLPARAAAAAEPMSILRS